MKPKKESKDKPKMGRPRLEDKLVKMNVWVDDATYGAIQRIASKEGRPLSNMARKLLQEAISRYNADSQ